MKQGLSKYLNLHKASVVFILTAILGGQAIYSDLWRSKSQSYEIDIPKKWQKKLQDGEKFLMFMSPDNHIVVQFAIITEPEPKSATAFLEAWELKAKNAENLAKGYDAETLQPFIDALTKPDADEFAYGTYEDLHKEPVFQKIVAIYRKGDKIYRFTAFLLRESPNLDKNIEKSLQIAKSLRLP